MNWDPVIEELDGRIAAIDNFAPFARAVREHESASTLSTARVDESSLYLATLTHALATIVNGSVGYGAQAFALRLRSPYHSDSGLLHPKYDGFVRVRRDGKLDFLGGIVVSRQHNAVLALPVVDSLVEIAQGTTTVGDTVSSCVQFIRNECDPREVTLVPLYVGTAELDTTILAAHPVLTAGLSRAEIMGQITPFANPQRYWPKSEGLI